MIVEFTVSGRMINLLHAMDDFHNICFIVKIVMSNGPLFALARVTHWMANTVTFLPTIYSLHIFTSPPIQIPLHLPPSLTQTICRVMLEIRTIRKNGHIKISLVAQSPLEYCVHRWEDKEIEIESIGLSVLAKNTNTIVNIECSFVVVWINISGSREGTIVTLIDVY